MKKNNLLACVALLPLCGGAAYAQSSGNFAASINTTQCTINRSATTDPAGALLGGIQPDSNGKLLLKTSIQTPNSSQTALIITPSLVTGLYTNTLVDESDPTSTQGAAVVVSVRLDGKPVLPATQERPGVIYDERFQKLSTNLFQHIEECSDDNTQTGDEPCNIELALSTLSAHSFNFIAPSVGGGSHDLEVEWRFECYDENGAKAACDTTYAANTAGACAGPGTVTVQQVKAFTQSGGITVK